MASTAGRCAASPPNAPRPNCPPRAHRRAAARGACTAGSAALLHHLADHGNRFLHLLVRHLEHQLVVHLEKHLRAELCFFQRLVHADHGAADDVGGRALDRRVDRRALLEGAKDRLRGADFGIVRAPPEQRLHIEMLAAERLGGIHVAADAGEALEIAVDVVRRLAARDAELRREPEGGDAVDDAEIDRLGAPADHRVHALDRHAEHFRRGHGVDVEPVGEGLDELRDVGDVREHAQLDLAVVGGDELAALLGDEGAADGAALLGAHRDVLQVGLR